MRALPQVLPAGLYEAASRRGAPPAPRSRPTSDGVTPTAPRLFGGQGVSSPQRAGFQQPMGTGDQWLVTPSDKNQFDQIFATVDTQNRGFITGEQAVTFFSNARLPEEALAQIWDLADINSEGQLNRDEFAVAMYLIRQQRSKTTGRDILPQSLPPKLIPPSMRRQPVAPQQPTAPVFDNAANITAPKSASEDLFGLDAISAPAAAPLQAKSTGDSSAYATPPRDQASPAPPPGQPSHFKPFVPSSSFGQSILTPQQTSSPSQASPQAPRSVPAPQRSATDDLLGDTDPEVSKRLTSETTDLANLSNQVGNLTGQMQEIKNKRGTTETDLNQAQNQKRQFEARLAELRSAYEQEIREVRSLEERLSTSKNDTKKLQSDMHMIYGTHQDLQNQHSQIIQALTADQNENASLKEKIRRTSTEIEQLKPQLEKLRSDARHQKGLVAINKKQLATHEAERDKLRGEMDGASKEHAEATKELEQTQRDLDTPSQPKAAQPSVASPPTITSPAPSTTSMNPFFRQPSGTLQSERGPAGSPYTSPPVNSNAFDSFFGPSAPSATPPPPTSFRSDSPSAPHGTTQSSHISGDGVGSATPPTSPPQSISTDSPATVSEPPAPPQSRQITSSFLPLRPNLEHSGSESSSVRVVPPASRMGERADDTPSNLHSQPTIPESPLQHFQDVQGPHAQLTPQSTGQAAAAPLNVAKNRGPSGAAHDVPGAFPGDETPMERSQPDFASPTSVYSNTGLDPRVDAPAAFGGSRAPQPPGLAPGIGDPFGKSSTPTSAKDDFESAFEGFTGDKGKAREAPNGSVSDDPFGPSVPGPTPSEFPPIRELDADDSDSESEKGFDKGFDDDFSEHTANKTKESGPNDALQGHTALAGMDSLAPSRPPFSSSDSVKSDLPTPGAQASPPQYEQVAGSAAPGAHGDRKSSNPFPPEFSGLLPSRDDPTSPPSGEPSSTAPSSTAFNPIPSFSRESTQGQDTTTDPLSQQRSPMSPGASVNVPYAYTTTNTALSNSPPQPASPIPQQQQQPPALPAKEPPTPKDDFDDFDDLAPAQEEDEKGDETIDFNRPHPGDTDFNANFNFNPVFDSPAPSRHTQGPSNATTATAGSIAPGTGDAFGDFAPNPSGAGGGAGGGAGLGIGNKPAGAGQIAGGKKDAGPVSHDWDAIFAGLDAAPTSTPTSNPTAVPNTTTAGSNVAVNGTIGGGVKAAGGGGLGGAGGPASPTGEDDPILKRLINMGFSRGDSLGALEKYDYNIDKVSRLLSFARDSRGGE